MFRDDHFPLGERFAAAFRRDFIQLGNLGGKTEAWFFWEMAGVEPAKMVQALSTTSRKRRSNAPRLELARASAQSANPAHFPQVIGLPLLKGVVGALGTAGDRRSLRTIPAAEMIRRTC